MNEFKWENLKRILTKQLKEQKFRNKTKDAVETKNEVNFSKTNLNLTVRNSFYSFYSYSSTFRSYTCNSEGFDWLFIVNNWQWLFKNVSSCNAFRLKNYLISKIDQNAIMIDKLFEYFADIYTYFLPIIWLTSIWFAINA